MKCSLKLGQLEIKNPIVLASGTFDRTITKHIDVSRLGAVTTKTLTLKPASGNPLPHIIKTEFGFINSVGLKNPGIKEYLRNELPFWHEQKAEVICSIGGENMTDFLLLAKILNDTDLRAIEINVSCPNVKTGSIFSEDSKKLKELILKIRKLFQKTLIVKLSPNVTDIRLSAKAALSGGADVLTLVNTFRALAIHPKTGEFYFKRKIGGYSGPAIKPMALRAVYEVYNKYKCPIIGGGGIVSSQDAIDFLRVGAKAIFIGSANYIDPKISIKILEDLEKEKICH